MYGADARDADRIERDECAQLSQQQIQRAYDLAGAMVGMLTQAIVTISKREDV